MTLENYRRLQRYEERLRRRGFYLLACRVRDWMQVQLETLRC